MNKEILKKLGFEKEVKRVGQGCCSACNCLIDLDGFRDDLSKREFGISGMCQKCQDETFGS